MCKYVCVFPGYDGGGVAELSSGVGVWVCGCVGVWVCGCVGV